MVSKLHASSGFTFTLSPRSPVRPRDALAYAAEPRDDVVEAFDIEIFPPQLNQHVLSLLALPLPYPTG